MAEEAPASTFASLVEALDAPGALGPRLDALARALGAQLGAEVGVVVPLVDAPVPVAGVDLQAAPDAASLPLDERGARLVVRPAAALAAPAQADLARAAARLVARELAWARREARADRMEDVTSAVTHEMNNALTPLLCHGCDPVVRESLRLRGLLDTLRVMRGRSRPRELRWALDVLERARRLLGLSGSGTFAVQVDCAPDAARRAIGPEQDRLLPALLHAGYALRACARAGAAVLLRGRLVDDGRLRLDVSAEVGASRDLVGDLAGDAVGPRDAGLEERLQLDGERVGLALTLRRRPRVVLLELPGHGYVQAAAVEAALHVAGIDVARAHDPAAAAAAAAGDHEPAAVLVLPGAPAQALRQALHRSQPLLASRCVVLDEQLVPRGPRPGPDEVDLGQLLAPARGAAP